MSPWRLERVNRRLNPELFDTSPQTPSESGTGLSAVAARKIEGELRETRKQVSHLESMIEVLQSQLTTLAEASEKRTNAFSKAISSLEQDFREQTLIQNRQVQNLESKIRDQRVSDGQTEALVERFNMSLAQFDNKLAAMKKVVSEKDMTLMSYRRVIEQIVDEVEKLKESRSPREPSRFL